MLIGNKWKIESNRDDIVLSELRKPVSHRANNKGDDRWFVLGYYSTPKAALRALVNQDVKETELTDLSIVVNKIDELYELIEGLEL